MSFIEKLKAQQIRMKTGILRRTSEPTPERLNMLNEDAKLAFDIREWINSPHWETFNKVLAIMDEDLDNAVLYKNVPNGDREAANDNNIARRKLKDIVTTIYKLEQEGKHAENRLNEYRKSQNKGEK